jgi:putative transposase
MKKHTTYTHARTCVYNIHYHIVWCVRYRRKVLTPEVESFLQQVLREIGDECGFHVSQREVGNADHVHVFVDAQPKHSITFIVQHLKGTSALRLFKQFPWLRDHLWKGHLWNGSYFVETIGSTSEDNVRAYIDRQQNVQL